MAEMNNVDESQRMTVESKGNWQYPSAAASGHIEVELPSLPGSPNAIERLHAVDFGPHVAGAVERSMTRNPYLKSGPQQSPAATFQHYVASARGAKLMDSGTLKRMETLAQEFETAPDQGEFFSQTVRPYLVGLTPKKRR